MPNLHNAHITVWLAAVGMLGMTMCSNAQTTTQSSSASQPATQPVTQPASQPATSPAVIAHLERQGKRDLQVHDPSTIVRGGGRYWTFITGHGVYAATSSDLKTWTPAPKLFEKYPDWLATEFPGHRGHFWAPDIVRLDDAEGERWLLYYSISSFGSNNSAIALATNRTLDPEDPKFEWKDGGIAMRSQREDHYNAIDPAMFVDGERLWMSYGSFWGGIFLIELDPATGLRKDAGRAPIQLAWNREIEAPYLHQRGEWYYLFVNWGLCCRGVNSTYEIRVGRSKSIEGPYLDRDGVEMTKAGGTPVLKSDGAFIGPGHPGIVKDEAGAEWFSGHFYDGSENGRPRLFVRPIAWDDAGWPTVE